MGFVIIAHENQIGPRSLLCLGRRDVMFDRKRKNQAFLNEVEQHERAWGQGTYTGRPKLQQILDAKVVAFWYPSGTDADLAMVITLHKDIKDIDRYVSELVLHTKVRLPILRLAKVFYNQQEIRIRAVHVVYERPK